MNMNAPLSTPTSSGGRSGVVGGDLLAELGDALLELVLGTDDRAADRGSGPRTPTASRLVQRPAVRPTGAPRAPPGELGARGARTAATASTRSTSASDGGGAPSHRRTARRANARRAAQRARGRALGAVGVGQHAPASSSRSSASARRTSAWRASTGTRSRSAMSSSSGSTSWRTRLRGGTRVVVRSGRRPARARARAHSARVSARRSAEQRAHDVAAARGHAREPARPLPRSRLSSTVSAWSSAVWPTSTTVGAELDARGVERGVARVARAGLEVRPGRDVDPHASRSRRRARRARVAHDARPRRRSPGRRPWSTCTATGSSPASAASDEQRERVGAAGARDDDRRDEAVEVDAPSARQGCDDGPTAAAAAGARGRRRRGRATSTGAGARRGRAGTRGRATRRRARGPGPRSTASMNASPTSYWRIFDSSPSSFCSERGRRRVLCRRAWSTRAMRACPATCSRAEPVHHHVAVALEQRHQRLHLAEHARAARRSRTARRGRRRRAGCGRCAHLVDRAAERLHEHGVGSGSTDAEQLARPATGSRPAATARR